MAQAGQPTRGRQQTLGWRRGSRSRALRYNQPERDSRRGRSTEQMTRWNVGRGTARLPTPRFYGAFEAEWGGFLPPHARIGCFAAPPLFRSVPNKSVVCPPVLCGLRASIAALVAEIAHRHVLRRG